MMSSSQIAQMNHHAFAMGYGANPGLNSHESISGITPFGHGGGTQAGVGLVSGMSSTANALSLAGLAAYGGSALLTKLGIGAGAAKGLGTFATMTGATLPLAASLGLVMPGMAALGGMASGAQQYAQTQSTLDRAFGNRLGMGGAFGYGVGREDARQLTEAMRSMKAIPEMMTSMGELQDILNSVSNMGILTGVRDAAEFKNKFTSMVHALRDMSRDLGTTMKEATALFSASVGQGFLDVDQAMINARMAKSGSAVGIGMDTARMMGLQSGGAAFLRSMGADSRAGAFGARDFATSISVAQSQGLLSAQDILTITGKTGQQGVADLSQSLMKAQVNLFQNTGAGKFLTAALAKRDDRGMFTGALDQDVLKRLRSGQISGSELMRLGQSALSGLDDEQALSFTNAMAGGMGASAGALSGVGGSATALNAVLDEMGADNDEAARALVRKLTGASQRQADVMLQLARNSARINRTKNNEMLQAAVRDRSVSFFKESMLTGQLHHIQTALQRTFVDPFQRAGTSMATRASRVFDEMTDEFVRGTTMDRIGMLTFGMPKNIARLLFDDPSRSRLTQSQIREGTLSFLKGESRFSDSADKELGAQLDDSLFYEASGSEGSGTAQLLLAGAAPLSFGVTRLKAGIESVRLPVINQRLVQKILGDDRNLRGRDFKSIMNRQFTGDQRRAAMGRFNEALGEIGSVSDLRGRSLSQVSEFVASLADENMTGLETLSAAGGLSGADSKNARDAAEILRSMISAGASASETTADAENNIRAAFTGGFMTMFNDEASAGGVVGAYFMSETSMSLALSGNKEKQQAILKLLENEDLAKQVIRSKDNPEELQRLSLKHFNGAISKEELKMIAKDMTNTADGAQNIGGIEYDAFQAVAKRIRNSTERIRLDQEQLTSQEGLDSIRERYGDAASSVISGIQSGGLFANFGSISSAILNQRGGSARFKNLQRDMKQNIFKGFSEKRLLEHFKGMGLGKEQLELAGIVFDENLDLREQETASALAAVTADLTQDIASRSSPEMQRAARLGMTPELQLKIAEQYEKAIVASEKTMLAHTDAIVKTADAVAKLQTAQNIGTEVTP